MERISSYSENNDSVASTFHFTDLSRGHRKRRIQRANGTKVPVRSGPCFCVFLPRTRPPSACGFKKLKLKTTTGREVEDSPATRKIRRQWGCRRTSAFIDHCEGSHAVGVSHSALSRDDAVKSFTKRWRPGNEPHTCGDDCCNGSASSSAVSPLAGVSCSNAGTPRPITAGTLDRTPFDRRLYRPRGALRLRHSSRPRNPDGVADALLQQDAERGRRGDDVLGALTRNFLVLAPPMSALSPVAPSR